MKTALARAWLQLTFVAYQACQMTHAIAITIARVAVTHRKMLEWQTAATVGVAARAGRAQRARGWFVRQMLVSPLFAAVALIVVSAAPAARAAGGPSDPAAVDRRAAAGLLAQPARRARAGRRSGRPIAAFFD